MSVRGMWQASVEKLAQIQNAALRNSQEDYHLYCTIELIIFECNL
jgi:hypothetical protein